MFREMRRFSQALNEQECRELLEKGTSGVLAVIGDGEYPYAVPLSYVLHGNTLYFHCATSGHKIDAIKQHEKVSFCVIAQDQVSAENYTTYYKSVIVFGKARILSERNEIVDSLMWLSDKYCPDFSHEKHMQEIDRFYDHVCMLAVTIDFMSGKQAKELIGTIHN